MLNYVGYVENNWRPKVYRNGKGLENSTIWCLWAEFYSPVEVDLWQGQGSRGTIAVNMKAGFSRELVPDLCPWCPQTSVV